MDIEKPVIVIYTEEIARDAVWTFVWRRAVVNQKTLWLVEAAMTALLGLMIFYGARDWLMAVVVTAVLLPPCLVVAAWFANYRNTVGKFRRMPSKQATFVFHEEGFEVTSELGATALPWSRITGLWERSGYWMLLLGHNQFVTLPIAAVPTSVQVFLRSKCSSQTR